MSNGWRSFIPYSTNAVSLTESKVGASMTWEWSKQQQENVGCQLASQSLSSHLSKPVAQGSNNSIKIGNYKRSKSWTPRFTRFTNTETPLYKGDKLIHKFFKIIKHKGSWNCSACHQALHYTRLILILLPSILILFFKLSLSFMLNHIKVLYKFNAHYAILYSILQQRWRQQQQQQHKQRQEQQHISTKHISWAK